MFDSSEKGTRVEFKEGGKDIAPLNEGSCGLHERVLAHKPQQLVPKVDSLLLQKVSL